jgi:hypothetical protein
LSSILPHLVLGQQPCRAGRCFHTVQRSTCSSCTIELNKQAGVLC